MGLDVSHDCWSGGYSAFNRFRCVVAKAAGGSHPPHDPDFRIDDGAKPVADWWYYDDEVVPVELHKGCQLFLGHSDCDGVFTPEEARLVAQFLRWASGRINEPTTGHMARVGSNVAQVAVQYYMWIQETSESPTALPDLTSPATLGCLLALVREVHPECRIDLCDGMARVIRAGATGNITDGWLPVAEALVLALEAAP